MTSYEEEQAIINSECCPECGCSGAASWCDCMADDITYDDGKKEALNIW